jgi:arylsulfatase
MLDVRRALLALLVIASLPSAATAQAPAAKPGKPNILVIMGDDIGWFNPSIYNHGLMGYQTPIIDSIA